jgi:hemoglobin-like flavoprotein
MDPQRIKDNFALVTKHGDDVAAYFYSDLFERDPGLRSMFPAAMGKQHEKLLGALSQIVSLVDDTPELVPFLQDLGRRHQGFGVSPEHYPEVGASLVNTLSHFSGPAWTPELEQDWATAYGLVAQVMAEGGDDTE